MQLVVMSMHRSGSSALMGLLQGMGWHLGEAHDFNPADESNPRGYFEHREVWKLNREILRDAGVNWFRGAEFKPSTIPGERRRLYQRRADAVVAALDARRPWAIKDPRLCLSFPIWRDRLRRPCVLLLYRHPGEVARSLQRRDGFALPFGLALWEHYTRCALRYTRGLRRTLVSHRELMLEPRRLARRLLQWFESQGVRGLAEPPDGAIEDWIDPGLFRQRIEGSSGEPSPTLPQQHLIRALEAGEIPDPADLDDGRANREWLVTYGRMKQRMDEDARVLDAVASSREWRWGRRAVDFLTRLTHPATHRAREQRKPWALLLERRRRLRRASRSPD